MSETEWVDNKADVWRVRECIGEDGCAVVERWLSRDPGVQKQEARELAAIEGMAFAEALAKVKDRDATPRDEVHIPLDVLPNIIAALTELHGELSMEASDE